MFSLLQAVNNLLLVDPLTLLDSLTVVGSCGTTCIRARLDYCSRGLLGKEGGVASVGPRMYSECPAAADVLLHTQAVQRTTNHKAGQRDTLDKQITLSCLKGSTQTRGSLKEMERIHSDQCCNLGKRSSLKTRLASYKFFT